MKQPYKYPRPSLDTDNPLCTHTCTVCVCVYYCCRDTFGAVSIRFISTIPSHLRKAPCCVIPDLVELVGTLPAEVVLAGQDHHRFVEELQADGTDQLFLQRCQRRLTVCSPTALQAAQVGRQRHGRSTKLHLLLLGPADVKACTVRSTFFTFTFSLSKYSLPHYSF